MQLIMKSLPIIFIGLVACVLSPTSKLWSAQVVRVGYPSLATGFAASWVTVDKGIWKKHGLDVEMKLVPNSSTTPAALIAESLQVATPTAPVTMQAIEQGLDLMVVAGGGVYVKGMTDVAVMVKPESPIKTASPEKKMDLPAVATVLDTASGIG